MDRKPISEYHMMSKIYVDGKRKPLIFKIVKLLLLLYILLSIFKMLMEGRFVFSSTLPGVVLLLIIIGAAYRNTEPRYERVAVTISFFENCMQAVYGMKNYGDGHGNKVRLYEVYYENITGIEYSSPLVCLKISGKIQTREYKNETMVDSDTYLRASEENQEIYLYLENDKAAAIVEDIKQFSNIQPVYLN